MSLNVSVNTINSSKYIITSHDETQILLEEAIVEANKGIFVSNKKVEEWIFSLGTDKELPMPTPDVFKHG